MKYYDTFISYGRADSKAFATKLYEELKTQGLNVWFDQEDIPLAVDFQEQINDGISKAHNFLFIIAPHAVNSPYCLKEIELAIQLKKRIIPLLHVEQISYETWQTRNPNKTENDWEEYKRLGLHSSFNNIHPEISKINWVYFREELDDFNKSLTGLLSAIAKHQEYVEQHTKILLQALEWIRNKQPTTYLLVGEERQESEKWLKQKFVSEQAPCIPTDLHCEFICESTKNGNNLLTEVFLAASEKDEEIKEEIRKTLMRESVTVWTKTRDIKTGSQFQEAIDRGIAGADNFVYLVSEAGLKSEHCQQEVNYALEYKKRIILLLIEKVNVESMPPELKQLQFIDFTGSENQDKYNISADKLLQEIKKEATYHEQHKILLVKAQKWERQNRNPSLLLQGYNLQHFEAWFKVAKQRNDYPCLPLQEEFINASLHKPVTSSLEVFISYSRTDSDLAIKLNDALQELGKNTWFDQESIATDTDFQKEIYHGIENSDNFVFIISPRSINSPYCKDEVEYACKLNKRIVTILHRPLSGEDKQKLPPGLAEVQWLDFNQHGGDFFANFNELVRTLDTDREYIRNHTKWSQRALGWEDKNKSTDLLLIGSEFAIAKEWLEVGEKEKKNPPATELQKEYINQSEKAIAATRKKEKQQIFILRSLLVGASVALVGAIGGIFMAFSQLQQAKFNQAESLARYSLSLMNEHKELEAFITAIKAGKIVQSQNRTNPEVLKALHKVLFEGRERNRLQGHRGLVTSVSFSPDGKIIATGSSDKTARLWNLNGDLIHELKGHQGLINSVTFSPDGKIIATASFDGTARLWNLQGNLIHELKGHQGSVTSVSFSPDGKTIATASSDKTAWLWNLQGKPIQKFIGHKGLVSSVRFSPDGKTLATGSFDNTARLWNLQGKAIQEFIGHEDTVTSIRFSPDGKTIATASDDNTARLWNLQGTMIRQFIGHEDTVTSLSFSPDGKTLATASYDNTARLWNLQGTMIREFIGHEDPVWGVSFSPDGKTIATASWDKTARLWKLEGQLTQEFIGHQDTVRSVSFSPDAKTIATGSWDNTARLWNSQGIMIQGFIGHQGDVNSVSFSPDGKTIATGSSDNTMRLWNLQGIMIQEFIGHEGNVNSVSFSPDGKTIATASSDNTARLWNLQGNLIQEFIGHQGDVNSVSFSPDGKTLATGSWDNTARLWNLQGKMIQEFVGHQDTVRSVSFSPDGKTLATASWDNRARLWNLQGKMIQEFVGHQDTVRSANFSPDGKTIVTTSSDNTARLWNLQGKMIQEFVGHEGSVNSASFSPDGKTIATASSDKTARFWNLQGGLIQEFKGDQSYVWNDSFTSAQNTTELASVDNLDLLLVGSCDWVRDYLTYNSHAGLSAEDKQLCHDSD